MMSDLRLLLLGSAHLERAGRELEVETRNALGLLVYLAVTKQTYTRDTLATLFWPEKSTSAARTHLRKSLWVLKKAVGENLLVISQQGVGINSEADLWLDVDHSRHLLAGCQQHDHAKEEVCADCLSPLDEAVKLYRGDFLAGFALADSSQFDDWQFFQAESLSQHEEARRLYKQALELAAKHDQTPIVLNIFTGLAVLMMQAGELQKALEILLPAARHPSSSYETKDKARKLLAEMHIDSASDASPVIEDHHTVEWQAIAADILAS